MNLMLHHNYNENKSVCAKILLSLYIECNRRGETACEPEVNEKDRDVEVCVSE